MATTESAPARSDRIYLAMVLLAFFVGPTGLARVYRGDKAIGWGRFWTFIGCLVFGFIGAAFPPLLILAGLVQAGLSIWGIVDFFLLYGTKTDASGHALIAPTYDKKVAKVFFVVFIVLLALSVVGIIIGLIFGVAAFNAAVSYGMHSTTNSSNSSNNSSLYNNSTSAQLFTKSEANSIQAGMTKAEVESTLHNAQGDCSTSTTQYYSYEMCTYSSGSGSNAVDVYVDYEDGAVSSVSVY